MAESPLRVRLDLTEINVLPYKYVWVPVSSRELKTIDDFKSTLFRKFSSLEGNSIKLFVQDSLLLDEETIHLLRDDDTVKVVYEEQLSCINQDSSSQTGIEKVSSAKRLNEECDNDWHIPAAKKLKKSHKASENLSYNAYIFTGKEDDTEQSTSMCVEQINLPEEEIILKKKKKKKKSRKERHSQSEESGKEVEEICPSSNENPKTDNSCHSKASSNVTHVAVNTPQENVTPCLVTKDNAITKKICPEIFVNNATEASFEMNDEPTETILFVHNRNSNCRKKKRKRNKKRKVDPEVISFDTDSFNSEDSKLTHSSLGKTMNNEDCSTGLSKRIIYTENGQSSVSNYGVEEKESRNFTVELDSHPKEFNVANMNSTSTPNSTASKCISAYNWGKTPMDKPLRHTSPHLKSSINSHENQKKVDEVSAKVNYHEMPSLHCLPNVGSRIAFKMVEMNDMYCPEITDYKEGIVRSHNAQTDEIEIEFITEEIKPGRMGKFENIYEDEIPPPEVVKNIHVSWMTLIEPKLVTC